ncbi:sushi, von Willebrand factor type A, EGF and pentraxin domain-containing protein 1-like isoform X3 [Varroa destructor]|nr:sushi, von Willebrand factor type A, EGF and pentraxin domain-containing protein 1-like isoform X3 [Varroa destructor]
MYFSSESATNRWVFFLAIFYIARVSSTLNEIVEYPLSTIDATIDIKKLEQQSERLKSSLGALHNNYEHGIDIAFLVDSSLSVGLANFKLELRFVKKILADFSISHLRKNTTRVTLVTFSSPDKVVTHVDFISPNGSSQILNRHKCSLMAELAQIQYVGGLTYTLGAMKIADRVLGASNRSVPQVVFLVTDGFSNGGDPKPIARKLKSRGVTIFTFGIKNGNVKELQDMATTRKEHCFIVNSFEEFEALARRALHQDLSVGDFEPLDLSQCNGLCPAGQLCCQSGARCACGTTSGYFSCLCPRGQYGTGLKGECKPCPKGTYQPRFVHGGIEECLPCPGSHQTSPSGSHSKQQCSCKSGFTTLITGNSSVCMPVRCPALVAPLNGFLVNEKCESVFNAACGVACETGYKLSGPSILVCNQDGRWSGEMPKCHKRKCQELTAPNSGWMKCTTRSYQFETECEFGCSEGFVLVGSKRRNCLAVAHWDGLPATCRQIYCPALDIPANGRIFPLSCNASRTTFGDQCRYRCQEGYRLTGPSSRECIYPGVWTDHQLVTRCVDTKPPSIECPDNILVPADPGEPYATVDFSLPSIQDNSGFQEITLTVSPAVEPPLPFFIGDPMNITYTATDSQENKNSCTFSVTVIDEEPPTVDRCESPAVTLSSDGQGAKVVWEEPLFSDNSNEDVFIWSSHKPGQYFPINDTVVTYNAADNSGNNASCTFNITVKATKCEPSFSVLNGKLNCTVDALQTLCHIQCDRGFTLLPNLPNYLRCIDGVWNISDIDLPSCTTVVTSSSGSSSKLTSSSASTPVVLPSGTMFECTNEFLSQQLSVVLKKRISMKNVIKCRAKPKCYKEKLKPICEVTQRNMLPISSHAARKRRSVSDARASKSDKDSDTDLNLEDEDMILHSMDDMMSSVRDGLNQRNQSYHSLCPLGWVHIDERTCVECPVGTFHNFLERTCSPCPFGTYQFKGGQLSCVVCPDHTSTAGESSKSADDCKPQCVPGMFSKNNGVIPCETCLLGEYQPQYGSKSCRRCPIGMTTMKRRSFQLRDCRERCPSHSVSRFGVAPCYPCPTGYHQPLKGQKGCIPATVETSHNHSEYLPFNACFLSPCQNDATCIPMDKHFACTCLPGYTGSYCEKRIDECALLPCGLNATCVLHETSGYTCLCPPGLRGQNCDEDVNECALSSCLNGATCVNIFGSFQCICPDGYTGLTCSEDIDECSQQRYGQFTPNLHTPPLCHNGGQCVNIPGSFRCECLDEFTGQYCEHLSCDCQNGGSCSLGKCFCRPGFWGNKCQHLSSKSYCEAVKPCFNGGTCKDVEPDSFSCQCQPGTTGLLCEEEVAENFLLQFLGNTTSDSARLSNHLGTEPLEEFTVCLWLKSNDTQNYGTPFSYASDDKDNLITITDYSGLVFYVNNEHVISDITVIDDRWHHLCFLWSLQGGHYAIYVNSKLTLEGGNLSASTLVSPNGTLILGQEQDQQGSGFARMESYAGLIAHAYFWKKRLRTAEIKALFTDCSAPVRVTIRPDQLLVAWGDFRAGVRGNVKVLQSNFCKPCGLPETTGNGYTTSNGQISGARVQWHCDPHFELIGSHEAVCLKVGEWSAPKPACVGKYCPVGQLDNGRTIPPKNLVEVAEVVRFECNEGLHLRGSSIAVCESTARLNITDYPSCSTSRSKLSLTPRRCPADHMEILKRNLGVARTSNDSTTEESFRCPAGFRLEGIATRFCRSGEWSASLPSCYPIVCPPLQPITPTSVTYSDGTLVGSTATLRCAFGFKLRWKTPNVLLCNLRGDWQPTFKLEEACEPIECGPLPQIQNAVLQRNTSHHVGSVIHIECVRGFSVAPSLDVRLICLQSGIWSQPSGNLCEPKQCSFLQLPQVDGSSVILHNGSTSFGSLVEISCERGFRSVTSMTRMQFVCSEDGWQRMDVAAHAQSRLIQCRPIRCPHPRHPPNGRAYFVDRSVGATIEFSCGPGYTFSEMAPQESVCQEDSTWSVGVGQLENVCVRRRACSHLVAPLNGYMNITVNQANFSCGRGFQLVGSHMLRCINGQWTDVAPECQPERCPVESEGGLVLENGIFSPTRGAVGDRVSVSCKVGYKLRGDVEWHCLENATWSGSTSCVPVTCAPPEDSFVTPFYKDYRYGSSIDYSCNQGHVLVGSRIRVCLATGQWSAPVPNCRLVTCPPPVDNRSLNITYDPYNSTLFGTRVRVSCASPEGHLIGASQSLCGDQGVWDPPLPVCLRTTRNYCLTSGPPTNGRVEVIGDIYRFSCDSGYRLIGNPEINCKQETMSVKIRPPK